MRQQAGIVILWAQEAWSRQGCGGYSHIYNQNMIGQSNKIDPNPNANGWDFGDNVKHEEGMLFEEDLLEYHREKTKCDPLTAVCTILFCPIFILMLMTWGPFARENENCFGHTYFAQNLEA